MAMKFFHVYNDALDILREMSPEARGRLLLRLCEHSCDDGYTEELGAEERLIAMQMCKQLDRDKEKYQERCERNRENGRKGGRPSKAQETDRDILASEKSQEEEENENENENKNKKEEENKDQYQHQYKYEEEDKGAPGGFAPRGRTGPRSREEALRMLRMMGPDRGCT
ncbi:MAG: hypothetical protein IJO51_03860 [Clostridia bacterium]|nr:hypothetical protein [Clostridia bacterium]